MQTVQWTECEAPEIHIVQRLKKIFSTMVIEEDRSGSSRIHIAIYVDPESSTTYYKTKNVPAWTKWEIGRFN